jgi:cytidine deaminase
MPEQAAPPALSEEDAKLVTLARSARARTSAPEGAAVRDDMGRTYVAASVSLRSLQLSAVQAAVAAALSSGSTTLEAVVVVTSRDGAAPEADRALMDELGSPRMLVVAPHDAPAAAP